MRTSPYLLTSSFFSQLFFDNADMVCNITAHGGCSVTVRISDQMSRGDAEKLLCLEQSGKSENGLDYSVTLAKRPRNVPNWLQ